MKKKEIKKLSKDEMIKNIDKLKDNLASVAALIAAVAAIGGGFVKYGEISTRLSQIEAAQGNVVDVSGITTNAEDIAVLKEKVSKVESQKKMLIWTI